MLLLSKTKRSTGTTMNKLCKAIIFSLSSAVIAAPAMAAPHDQGHQQATHQQNVKKQQPVQKHQSQQKHSINHRADQPSRDWKVGQKVPSQFYGNGYKIDHTKYKKLSKPGKNQHWIKVNNDYVLTNVVTHAILKIVHG